MNLENLKKELQSKSNKEKANLLQRYFKTGKGDYADGDIFLGITVPEERRIAIKFAGLVTLKDAEELLKSKIHEERFVALEILVFKYEKGNSKEKKDIYGFYLKNARYVNNWDLVDTSAPYIVGNYLIDKNKAILYKLAKSENLWEKRISIISTYEFIKIGKFDETIKKGEFVYIGTDVYTREDGKIWKKADPSMVMTSGDIPFQLDLEMVLPIFNFHDTDIDVTFIGTEEVNGYKTRKYSIISKQGIAIEKEINISVWLIDTPEDPKLDRIITKISGRTNMDNNKNWAVVDVNFTDIGKGNIVKRPV